MGLYYLPRLEIKIHQEKLKGGIDSMLRSFILFAGLVLALGLAGCPQQADEPAGDAEVVVEEVQDPAGDTAEMVEEPAADATDDSDAANDDRDSTTDDNSDNSGY